MTAIMTDDASNLDQPIATTDYAALFKARLDEIDELESTPVLVRDIALTTLNNASKAQGMPHAAKNILANGTTTLKNIGQDSLSSNFKVIYAQMCVLAVSSLEALLKTYFANAANAYQQLDRSNAKLGQIKVSLSEILDSELRFGGKVGNLILEKDKPNFQDLKSIKETFKTYYGMQIELDAGVEKELCFYLECRHVLVHRGGNVDKKFIESTKIMDANLKDLKEGQAIEIDASDWKRIKYSFSALVTEVTKKRT